MKPPSSPRGRAVQSEPGSRGLVKARPSAVHRLRGLRRKQEREKRYQQLFESSPLPLWVYDLETLRFLDVNEVACQKYGYTREEFLSMSIRDIRPAEDVAAVEASVRDTPVKVFNSGIWRHRLKSGEIIYVEITSHEMRFLGRLTRFVCPIDVTERLKAQAAMHELNDALERRVAERTAQLEASNRDLVAATQAAERANRSKSEFLAGMSHELRTPLNAIQGFSQLLLLPDHGFDPDRQRLFLSTIHQAGEHLLSLIGELLNLAQIESGLLTLNLHCMEVSDVLQECEALMSPQAAAAGIGLSLLVPTPLPRVVADRTRLKQVLLNLMSNAVKYNQPRGRLELRVSEPADGRVRLQVSDTGAGLSPEQLARLFEPFNRLGRKSEGAGATQGTGLGLVVSRQLVELMGGVIGVASTPGVGSRFWIDLVACADEQARENAAERPRTVLSIDSWTGSLDAVKAILAPERGIRLVSARNAREGFALALAHEPDAVVLDIGESGPRPSQAAQLLQEDRRTGSIPLIGIGEPLPTNAEEPSAGPTWFRVLTGPVDRTALLQAIEEAFGARQA